jgi:hypothetical protein
MKKKPSWGSCKNSNQNEFELYDWLNKWLIEWMNGIQGWMW